MFGPSKLGSVGFLTIVLVFIGLRLIDCLTNHLKSDSDDNQKVRPMRIKKV